MSVQPVRPDLRDFLATHDGLLGREGRERLRRRIQLLERLEDAGDMAPPFARLRAALETSNEEVYAAIREAIRAGDGRAALTKWLDIDWSPGVEVDAREGYDDLDTIVAGVVQFEEPGASRVEPTDEMVFYQPTPARHIVDLLRRTALTSGDVLVDLGAGLGHVAIMTAIGTQATAVGVEIEPAYVDCARRAAERLGLDRARFVQADAREASLDEGTVFFLYTPFSGGILRTVLDRLRHEAERRPIRVCTYGPCTTTVAAERWLRPERAPHAGRVTIFLPASS